MRKKKIKVTKLPDGSAFAKVRIPTPKRKKEKLRIVTLRDHSRTDASFLAPSTTQLMLVTGSVQRIADALEAMNTRQQHMEELVNSFAQIALQVSDLPKPVKDLLRKATKRK
jgi:hypothetical protein